MVEVRFYEAFGGDGNTTKVHNHARLRTRGMQLKSLAHNLEAPAMAVQTRALAVMVRQAVRGFEAESFAQDEHVRATVTTENHQ